MRGMLMNRKTCRWAVFLLGVAVLAPAGVAMVDSGTLKVKAAVRDALDTRARALLHDGKAESVVELYDTAFAEAETVAGADLAAYEQERVRAFHAYAAEREMKFVTAKVHITFLSADIVGSTADVEVIESLSLGYHYVESPSAVTTFGLDTPHRMQLVRVSDRWLIRRDAYLDPLNEALEPDHLTPRASYAPDGDSGSGTLI